MKTRLRELREEKGLSMKELAEISKVSDAQICRIENNERSMTVETMVKLVKALEVSSDYFLGLEKRAIERRKNSTQTKKE